MTETFHTKGLDSAARGSRPDRRRRWRCGRSRAEVIGAAVVVVGQLEHRLLVADAEEVVRRLELAVADGVHVALEGEPQRLVEGGLRSGSVIRTIVCRNAVIPPIVRELSKGGGQRPAALRCQCVVMES